MTYAAPQEDNPILSESDFFQRVKKRTLGTIYFERVEPANESGFPDTYFVVKQRGGGGPEGTLELKWSDAAGAPDLSGPLMRGNQKAALLDYEAKGGHRRFYLSYSNKGDVWFFNTADAAESVRTGVNKVTAMAKLEEPSFCAWLTQCLK